MTLRELHRPGGALVVPNAWDAASARVLERAGFPTIATGSAAVAAALGREDGQDLPYEELVAAVGRICRAVSVPVSVDAEGGYRSASHPIERTVRDLVAAGAAGINLEDTDFAGRGGTLVPREEHAEAIARARVAEPEVWLNGRTDVFLKGGDPAEATERLLLYAEAGADCAFAPGAVEPATIGALCAALPVPLNVMRKPQLPPLAELRALGVGRISMGSDGFRVAMAALERRAAALAAGELHGPTAP
jgi:2-methylisocitrate lyase-like PEP mutase family enzyme